MLTKETLDLIQQLRAGRLDPSQASALEGQQASAFIASLKSKYLVAFQERQVGDKHEVGLARSLSLELARRQVPNSLFAMFFFMPVLRRCVFVSSYHDRITEITTTASIQVVPDGGDAPAVTLKMGPGFKLDKTPDGWVVKKLKNQRRVTLTESFLSSRGWNFNVFKVKIMN